MKKVLEKRAYLDIKHHPDMPHTGLTEPREEIHKAHHVCARRAQRPQRGEIFPVAVCNVGVYAEAALQRRVLARTGQLSGSKIGQRPFYQLT